MVTWRPLFLLSHGVASDIPFKMPTLKILSKRFYAFAKKWKTYSKLHCFSITTLPNFMRFLTKMNWKMSQKVARLNCGTVLTHCICIMSKFLKWARNLCDQVTINWNLFAINQNLLYFDCALVFSHLQNFRYEKQFRSQIYENSFLCSPVRWLKIMKMISSYFDINTHYIDQNTTCSK